MDAGGYSTFLVEVHQDVLIEILSRLSVKSLIRCRCVCKSWNTLIKSSDFITKHLQRSHKTLLSNDTEETPLFVICNRGLTGWMVSYIMSTINNDDETEMAALPDSLPYVEHVSIPKILGPVNGIYCWRQLRAVYGEYEYDSLFFCNPALREVKSIPKIPRPAFVDAGGGSHYIRIQTYGFGYDYKANDYKVVAVTGSGIGVPPEKNGHQIFVYSLSSSPWRKIQIDIDNFPACPESMIPVLTHGNGVCHWLAEDKRKHQVILSFDFGSEAFKSSPLPNGLEQPHFNKSLYLSVLNESTIILIAMDNWRSGRKYSIETGCCYEIFRMLEDGSTTDKEVWTMLYTLGPITGGRQPLGLRKNGGITLAKFGGSLVTYDPSCQQIKNLHFCGEGFEGHQVCTYMESLVSIHGGSGGA